MSDSMPDIASLYLDLMKKCLTRLIAPEEYREIKVRPSKASHPFFWAVYPLVTKVLASKSLRLFKREPFDHDARENGRTFPESAETMIGMKRLNNIQFCVTEVLRNQVPGDLIETGVWRGGASIFMRSILKAYGDTTRTVWLADSFAGLPKPDGRYTYKSDAADDLWMASDVLAISLDQVKANFSRYGLLDDQVRFLKGWFKDTLPTAPVEKIAVARLDGDMYESTMDALKGLYHKISIGGFVIIDDYTDIPSCKQAVDDFRTEHGITEDIHEVDWTGVYWQKLR